MPPKYSMGIFISRLFLASMKHPMKIFHGNFHETSYELTKFELEFATCIKLKHRMNKILSILCIFFVFLLLFHINARHKLGKAMF